MIAIVKIKIAMAHTVVASFRHLQAVKQEVN
jgi:hypothetical protein